MSSDGCGHGFVDPLSNCQLCMEVEIARLQAVVDAARAYLRRPTFAMRDALAAALRALDGEPCPTCDGGETVVRSIEAGGLIVSAPCPTCDGTGRKP